MKRLSPLAVVLLLAAPSAYATWSHIADGTVVNAVNTNTTPLTVTVPAGLQANDKLVLFVRTTTTGITFTNSDITTSLCSRDTNGHIQVFGKVASGSETSVTVSSNVTNRVIAWISIFRGGSLNVDSCATTGASSGGNVDWAAATANQANDLVLIAGGKNVNVTSAATPTNYTEMADASGSTTIYITGDYRILSGTGSIGAGSWAITGDTTTVAKSGLTIALKDAAGAPTFTAGPALGTATSTTLPTTFTVDQTANVYGVACPHGQTPPTITQTKAAECTGNAAAAASFTQAVTGTVSNGQTFTGLTAGTAYDLYFVANNANGDSSLGSIANASTVALAAPTFSVSPTVSSQTTNSYTLSYTPSASATFYAVACLENAGLPTAIQLKAGQCAGGVTAQASANKAVTGADTTTVGGSLANPMYALYAVLNNGGGDSGVVPIGNIMLNAPTGKQYELLTSISSTSFCSGLSSPAVEIGDILKMDTVVSPSGNALTLLPDCNLWFLSDGSRQSAAVEIYDASAGGFMAGGPGTLWFNDQPPSAPADNSVIFTYPLNQAITPVDLTQYCPDPENDVVTVTATDAPPTGLSVSGSTLSGTPTVGGIYASKTLTCTDAPGASTPWLVTYLIGNITIPNVVNESAAQAQADLQAAYFSASFSTSYSSSVALGNVVSQNPANPATAVPGATVALVISLGNPNGINAMATLFVPDGSALPSGAVYKAGAAFAQDGSEYVSPWPSSGNVVYQRGLAYRQDGALTICTSLCQLASYVRGIAATARGEAIAETCVPLYAVAGVPMNDAGHVCMTNVQ